MAKYKESKYHTGYFCGGGNVNLNLISCGGKVFIAEILKSYVLYCHHTYLLDPGMDRTVAMIIQHLHWPGIRKFVQEKVSKCHT